MPVTARSLLVRKVNYGSEKKAPSYRFDRASGRTVLVGCLCTNKPAPPPIPPCILATILDGGSPSIVGSTIFDGGIPSLAGSCIYDGGIP